MEYGFEKAPADVFGAHLHNFRLAYDKRKFALLLSADFSELLLGGDYFLNLNLCKFESFYKSVFGALFGGSLNHHHLALVADVHEVEGGVEHLLVGRVDYEFPVDFADSYAADRSVPRNVGNKQRRGRAVYHQNIGVVYHVRREQKPYYLDFIHKALRK